MQNGKAIANLIRPHIRLVKRRFVSGLSLYLDQPFFAYTYSEMLEARLTPDNIAEALGKAYDIRSRFVHTGLDVGGVLLLPAAHLPEINSLTLVGIPKETEKLLLGCLTFVGLERIIWHVVRTSMNDVLQGINRTI